MNKKHLRMHIPIYMSFRKALKVEMMQSVTEETTLKRIGTIFATDP